MLEKIDIIKPKKVIWNDVVRYNDYTNRDTKESYLIIKPTGKFKLNKTAIRTGGKLNQSPYLYLYYSLSNNAIIFKFSDKKEKGYIKTNSESAYRDFSAYMFFNIFRIDCQKSAGRYLLTYDNVPNVGECLVCYLDTNKIPKRENKKCQN
jgi:hypothetical protein